MLHLQAYITIYITPVVERVPAVMNGNYENIKLNSLKVNLCFAATEVFVFQSLQNIKYEWQLTKNQMFNV